MASSGNHSGSRSGNRSSSRSAGSSRSSNSRDYRSSSRTYSSGSGRSGSSAYPGSRKKMSRKRRAKRRRRIIMFTMEILLLMVLGVVLWGVLKQTSTQKININEEEIVQQFNQTVEENVTMKGYRNIALFGIDARDDDLGKGNRSDTIMIASINLDTCEVRLLSVYRDTYMNLGNDKYSKCNAAYAAGGPQQAVMMLNMNLDMNITDYVSVGFLGMIDVIDNLGGVQIDVKEEEIQHLNNYQASMFSTESQAKITDDYVKVTQPGLQTLNGMQATAYCRIRATAGDDFRRAERQRTVLMAIMEKAKSSSFSELNAALDSALPHVATSLDTSEMLGVLKDVAKYSIVSNDGFPFADSRATGKVGAAGSCVIPLSLESNVVKLHEFFFASEEYTPSEEVKRYSSKVASDTGK